MRPGWVPGQPTGSGTQGEGTVRKVVTFAFQFLLCAFAFAQTDRGTITGTISDPAGALVAAAPVEARNIETGALYQAASSATGNYTLSQLPAGNYEMSVVVPGFKRYVRQNMVGIRGRHAPRGCGSRNRSYHGIGDSDGSGCFTQNRKRRVEP